MSEITPIQRALLQLKQHAEFRNSDDPHDQAKRNAYLHSLKVVELFTGEKLPAQAAALPDPKQHELSLA